MIKKITKSIIAATAGYLLGYCLTKRIIKKLKGSN